MEDIMQVDGSLGEGGGSIIRLASALSILTQRKVRIANIRKNRRTPGLRHQHLTGLQLLSEISKAEVVGAALYAQEVLFSPKDEEFKELTEVKIETAASIGLVLQSIQLALAASKKPVIIELNGGATFGKWAPTIDYIQNVTYKVLGKIGYTLKLETLQHGFFPKGGAKVKVKIQGLQNSSRKFYPLQLDRQGRILSIQGRSIASVYLQRARVAERQAQAARRRLYKLFGSIPININVEYVSSTCPGSGITLWVQTDERYPTYFGKSAIGERGISAERVGGGCAQNLFNDFKTGAAIDLHLADQLLPYIAMTDGPSTITVSHMTSHMKTNMQIVEQFLGKKFKIRKLGKVFLIETSE